MNRIAIIERCGQCEHVTYFPYVNAGTWHQCDKRTGERGRVDPDAAPPDWCPLLKADEVARVKPLEWQGNCACTANGRYVVHGSARRWYATFLCDDDDRGRLGRFDAKQSAIAACEAAYRAALFGQQGPLAKL